MKTIFKCKFGSFLYGTSLPSSDTDYKSVYIPSVEDILLQTVKGSIHQDTNPTASKNTSNDVDHEMFSLQKYLYLLCEGQTVSLDMLFATPNCIIETSSIWNKIVANKDKFLHSGTNAMCGYVKSQAAKYGLKGYRVAAVESLLNHLQELPVGLKLKEYHISLAKFIVQTNNSALTLCEIDGANGNMEIAIDICDRKIPFHSKVGYAVDVLKKMYDGYGHRAKLAKDNQSIDWKALYHAVRVVHQVQELLTSGHITFPRPEKELLSTIRQGLMPYQEVAEIIEKGLEDVNKAVASSSLPAMANKAWVDQFIIDVYGAEVLTTLLK